MRSWIVIACLAGASSAAWADTLTLNPSRDNTLYEDALGSLSNGAGPALYAGKNSQGRWRRGVMGFDVSAIPAGSVVTGARLTLVMDQSGSVATGMSLHRLLADWGEGTSNAGLPGGSGASATTGDATWLHTFFSTALWATPGGDFAPGASASTTVAAPGTYVWSGPGMVADVQAWVDGSALNAGWLLQAPDATTGMSYRFASRESAQPSMRPVLEIEYRPVPAPGGLALIGLLALGARRRR
jgi:hypothetical protein